MEHATKSDHMDDDAGTMTQNVGDLPQVQAFLQTLVNAQLEYYEDDRRPSQFGTQGEERRLGGSISDIRICNSQRNGVDVLVEALLGVKGKIDTMGYIGVGNLGHAREKDISGTTCLKLKCRRAGSLVVTYSISHDNDHWGMTKASVWNLLSSKGHVVVESEGDVVLEDEPPETLPRRSSEGSPMGRSNPEEISEDEQGY